jgi:hypothetical protein
MLSEHEFPPNVTNLEAFFDEFIFSIGGKRVTDIFGVSPNFSNADYFIDRLSIICELKVLENDFINEKDYDNLTLKVIKSGENAKHFDGLRGYQEYVRNSIKIKIRDLVRRRLSRITEKANKQLKDTKSHGLGENFDGILLIINNGFISVPHISIFGLLCSILSQHYKSVNCLVYTSINLWESDGSDIAKLVWFPAYGDNASKELHNRINTLGREFYTFLADKGVVQLEHGQEFESHEDWEKSFNPR